MNRRSFIASSAAVIGAGWARREAFGTSYDRVPPEGAVYDVVVYGATASGVIAAVTAARQGLQTVLLEPGRRVGGMVSGGLGWTDFATSDDGAVIGGFAREFFSRVGRFYGAERTRRFNESVGNPRLGDVGWYFEPHVAENIMRQMLEEAGVVTSFGSRLRQTMAVKKNHTNVSEILLDNGRSYQGRVFIDATYEGDLMAQAGIAYTVGRETRSTYDEPLAGVLKANRDVALASSRQQAMPAGTSAYNSPGKLIVGVVPAPSQALGSADRKVQAYCFRLCLTKTPDNRIPFSRPEGYNPAQYELHARVMHAMQANDNNRPPTLRRFLKNSSIPNGKTDSNNQGPASTDFVNASWEYPEADYATRAQIWQNHFIYAMGFLYFLAHDSRVPEGIRREAAQWGLAKDEFTDTNNWPHQLYVREARRMIGDYVMIQRDIQTNITKHDSIAMGSYPADSHIVERIASHEGFVEDEGQMFERIVKVPYEIPYRILTPKRDHATNVLVTICFSASHVAYQTLRLEPQYMMCGQAAGAAAGLAVKYRRPVQDVDISLLQQELKKQSAILVWSPAEKDARLQKHSTVLRPFSTSRQT